MSVFKDTSVLFKGGNYYEFPASVKFKGRGRPESKPVLCSATVYVARINSLYHPFVIGSITNKSVIQSIRGGNTDVDGLRLSYKVDNRISSILRE